MKTIKQITLVTLVSAALWSVTPVLAAPNQLQAIHAEAVGNKTQLSIQFNTPVKIPKGFVMHNPPRIVFDFPGAEANPAARRAIKPTGVIRSVNAVSSRGRTRVVVMLKEFVDYGMELQGGNRLVLDFNNGSGATTHRAKRAAPAHFAAQQVAQVQAAPVRAPNRPTHVQRQPARVHLPEVPANQSYEFYGNAHQRQAQTVSYQPAQKAFVPHGARPAPSQRPRATAPARRVATGNNMRLSGLDFRRNINGNGRLILDFPRNNVVIKADKRGNVLTLSIPGVDIPTALRQRMDVVDFATPVANINVVQRGANGVISIIGGQRFTHRVEQNGNRQVIHIEKEKVDKVKQATKKEKKVFKGEKLSLNFQDIEVRAVLQLLADFTDKNIIVSDSVEGNITVRLKDVPWDQALDIVLETKSLSMKENGNVIWVAPSAEMEAKEEKELETAKRKVELEPLITEYLAINFAKASDLAALIQKRSSGEKNHSLLSDRGSVTLDERTNTLLIQDTAARVGEIRDLVKVLDVPVDQVLIESRIVTATDEFGKELGARFGVRPTFDNKDASGFIGGGLDDNMTVNLPVAAAAGQFGFSVLSPDFMLNLELSALQAENKGEVVATPRVITSNQTKATIKQGVSVPYLKDTSSGATSVEFKDAVLKLEVTPQITPDEHVSMDLLVSQDTVGNSFGSSSVPSINTREIQTKVTVANGQTVVLGGVHEEVKSKGVSKVPVFGDLPMVGKLFRRTSNEKDKRELLVFVTPKIMNVDDQ